MLGSFNGILPPGERISKLITELIADSPVNGGFIFVRSNVPIFLTALFDSSICRCWPMSLPNRFRLLSGLTPLLPSGCGSSPPINVLQPGATTQFQARDSGSFEWSVNRNDGWECSTWERSIPTACTRRLKPSRRNCLCTVVATGTECRRSDASVDVIAAQTLLEHHLGVVQSLSFEFPAADSTG